MNETSLCHLSVSQVKIHIYIKFLENRIKRSIYSKNKNSSVSVNMFEFEKYFDMYNAIRFKERPFVPCLEWIH